MTVQDSAGCNSTILYGMQTDTELNQTRATTSGINCFGSTGTLDLAMTGGTPPYTYTVGNVTQSYGTFLVPEGTYYAIATDSLGCTYSFAELQQQTAVSEITLANTTVTANVGCISGTGIVTVVPIGGSGTFQYSIDDDYFVSSNAITCAPGSCNFFVKDGYSCVKNFTFDMPNPANIVEISVTVDIPDNTCSSSTLLATITATATNGSSPYTFHPNGFSGFLALGNQYVYSVNNEGDYYIRVTDGDACAAQSQTVHISRPEAVVATPYATDERCYNTPTGVVTISPSGGIPPYNFSLNGEPYTTNGTFLGLTDKTYNTRIMDSHGCLSAFAPATVGLGVQIGVSSKNTPPACPGQKGSVNVTATGGAGGFTYSIDGAFYQSQSTFSVLPGSYPFFAKDSKGCIESSISQMPNTTYVPSTILSSSYVSTSGGPLYLYGYFFPPFVGTLDGVFITSFGLNVSLSVTVPAGNGMGHNISITDGCGTQMHYTWSYESPSVTSISGISDLGGPVTIHGQNFGDGTLPFTVTVGTNECSGCTYTQGATVLVCTHCPYTGQLNEVLVIDVAQLSSQPFNFTYIDINQCLTNNGNCDFHTTCKHTIAQPPTCGPCPTGFVNGTGNTPCIPLCGDGNCTSAIGENCVSCPADCRIKPCGQCGDGTCDNTTESCHTCSDDCGLCVVRMCPGTPVCSAHGSCVRGSCSCTSPWSGPDCSQDNTPVQISLNRTTTSPGFSISPVIPHGGTTSGTTGATTGGTTTGGSEPNTTPSVSFSISLSEIRELDSSGNIIDDEIFADNNYTFNPITPSSSNSFPIGPCGNCSVTDYVRSDSSPLSANKLYLMNTTLPNSAYVEFLIWQFNDAETNISFASNSSTFPANTIKIAVQIRNWPFRNAANSLSVIFLTSSSNTTSQSLFNQDLNATQDENDNLKWFSVNVDGVILYVQFLDQAIIDGNIRAANFSLNASDSTIACRVPHFWTNTVVDPNFSVLLGGNDKSAQTSTTSPSGTSSSIFGHNKKTNLALFIAVPVAVVLVVVIVVILLSSSKIRSRLKISHKKKKFEDAQQEEELEQMRKSQSIEKVDGMEVNSEAGQFSVRW